MNKTYWLVVLAVVLCAAGCSKQAGASKGKVPGIVPATAEAVLASPQFKLEHTTRNGIKCYTRPVTPEEYHAIAEKSADKTYLRGQGGQAFLLVPVRDGNIIPLKDQDEYQVSLFVMGKTLSSPGMMRPGGR